MGQTVAEVCVGKTTTRVNFREPFPNPIPALEGRSQTWRGGGMKVTPENFAEARELLGLAIGEESSTGRAVRDELWTEVEIRDFLDSIFGTVRFRLRGGAIEIDVHEGPGGAVHDRFVPPEDWQVLADREGVNSHAVGRDDGTSLCGLSREALGDPLDGMAQVSCLGCRVRLIAVEIAALPGSQPGPVLEHVTLHVEIARILKEAGNRWMTTLEIASAVNAAGRYRKQRRGSLTALNIHGRTRNYPALFERQGSRVRLRDQASPDSMGFSELIDHMDALADELGLAIVVSGTGKNYRPQALEQGVSATSGVGVHSSTRGVEFNLQVFRELGEDAVADDLLDRIRAVSGESTEGKQWPAVSCASIARNWPRVRADVMEPYFRARARHFET